MDASWIYDLRFLHMYLYHTRGWYLFLSDIKRSEIHDVLTLMLSGNMI